MQQGVFYAFGAGFLYFRFLATLAQEVTTFKKQNIF